MVPKFSLQNVLDVRHRKVELFEIELGKLLAARGQLELRLLSLREMRENLLEQLTVAQAGEMDLVKTGLLRLNISQVSSHIEHANAQFAHLQGQVESKRNELVKAKQSEETLEILKRRRYELYRAEQVKIDARLQDDIYIARAFRNQQTGV